jgi:RND family efflux transporter MFP subunit
MLARWLAQPPPPVCLSALLLAALALFGAGCSQKEGGQPRPSAVQAGSAPRVAVVRAEKRSLSSNIELAAEFRPYQEVDVHAKVAGYLKSISVDVGDSVTQGRVLGVLEVPEFDNELLHASALEKRSELDVIRARSEITRAQSALNINKLSYDRLLAVSAARPKLIAQQEIDTAAARFHEAEAQLATARAAAASIEQQVKVNAASAARVKTMLGYLQIVAPFSGVITKRYADTGAMIQAGTASQSQAMPVVRIAQVDRLRLILPVPESVVPRIRLGSPIEVRVDSLQRVFQGKVARFTGQLSTSTRTMDTQVDIVNSEGAIRPGMYGYASIVLDQRSDVLAVPVQALVQGAKPTLYVVGTDKRLVERPVRLGLETANAIEIRSGLQPGELVVVGGRTGLKPGLTVETKVLRPDDLEGGE